jgi:hypothetical protein
VRDHTYFVLGFCFLLVHDMDAIKLKEWKIFPVLSRMDEAGYVAFTVLHVPIYALLLWGLYGEGGINLALVVGLDAFFVVHVFLHLIFYDHPENRLRSVFSYALIFGAASRAANRRRRPGCPPRGAWP